MNEELSSFLDARYYPTAQIRQGADRDRNSARPMISPQTSYRLDNCHCARRAKDSDEQQVALHRRKTTTKRSQRREHDQLPHLRVHLQDTFHSALILEAPRPAGRGSATGPGLATTHGVRAHHDQLTNVALAAWFGAFEAPRPRNQIAVIPIPHSRIFQSESHLQAH